MAIERKRGDTAPDVYKFGAVVTGFSFRLTINSEESPSDTNQQIMQMTGTVEDSINGEVHFRPASKAEADALPIGEYFYDVEAISPRVPVDDIKTLESGTYSIIQDITK